MVGTRTNVRRSLLSSWYTVVWSFRSCNAFSPPSSILLRLRCIRDGWWWVMRLCTLWLPYFRWSSTAMSTRTLLYYTQNFIRNSWRWVLDKNGRSVELRGDIGSSIVLQNVLYVAHDQRISRYVTSSVPQISSIHAVRLGGAIMIMSLLLFENEFLNIVSISFTALVLNELIMVAVEITTWSVLHQQ